MSVKHNSEREKDTYIVLSLQKNAWKLVPRVFADLSGVDGYRWHLTVQSNPIKQELHLLGHDYTRLSRKRTPGTKYRFGCIKSEYALIKLLWNKYAIKHWFYPQTKHISLVLMTQCSCCYWCSAQLKSGSKPIFNSQCTRPAGCLPDMEGELKKNRCCTE